MADTHFKQFFTLVLAVLFLIQCYSVFMKFCQGHRTLSIEQKALPDLKFPSVTICPKISSNQTFSPEQISQAIQFQHWIHDFDCENDTADNQNLDATFTFQAMLENMPRTDFILEAYDPCYENGIINMRDDQHFREEDYSEIWTSYVTPSKELSTMTLTRCYTYNSPINTKSGHELHFTLEGTNIEWFQVFLHDKEQFFISNNKLYGSETFAIHSKSELSVEYELAVKRRIAMNADPVPCHDNKPYPLFHDCLDDYLERATGCALPWRTGSNTGLATCQSSIQFQKYWVEVQELIEVGESVLYSKTGCYTKCQRHYYKATKHEASKVDDEHEEGEYHVHMSLSYKEPEIVVETENLAYDLNDLIGDIGGYLGLLLGASVLTIWDICSKFLSLMCGKKEGGTLIQYKRDGK
ncbi:uncharacterized protein LOC131880512 [Tigriopus californicus]|uniref:uncharacterized protein LOC131880512 n=1 Tax=Tigriopus californicus TaxID=6832 RepID=UPI0027D9EAC6|nr:uncharacterized protein LOC131880512 [Tigriopus californicus]